MINYSSIVVPFWFHKTLKRNNMNLKEILDYSKIRNFFSSEDLAQLLRLNTGVNNIDPNSTLRTPLGLYSNLLSSWQKSAGSLSAELDSVVTPLSYSEGVGNYIKAKLSNDVNVSLSEGVKSNSDVNYYIVDIETNIFCIVLKQGFLDDCRDDSKFLNFVKDILKVFYVYNEIHEVSKESIFSTYLELLERSTLKA